MLQRPPPFSAFLTLDLLPVPASLHCLPPLFVPIPCLASRHDLCVFKRHSTHHHLQRQRSSCSLAPHKPPFKVTDVVVVALTAKTRRADPTIRIYSPSSVRLSSPHNPSMSQRGGQQDRETSHKSHCGFLLGTTTRQSSSSSELWHK